MLLSPQSFSCPTYPWRMNEQEAILGSNTEIALGQCRSLVPAHECHKSAIRNTGETGWRTEVYQPVSGQLIVKENLRGTHGLGRVGKREEGTLKGEDGQVGGRYKAGRREESGKWDSDSASLGSPVRWPK